MAVEVRLPELGENIESGTVATVLVKKGDRVEKDAPLVELETDKAVLEVPAPEAGTITEIHVGPGDLIKVGQVIVSLDPTGAAPPAAVVEAGAPIPPAAATAEAVPQPASVGQPDRSGTEVGPALHLPDRLVAATPSVRRLAREIGLDIALVRGSGHSGRITIEDVKRSAKQLLSSPTGGAAVPVSLPDFSKWGEIERQPMGGIRRATASHLSLAWSTIPHVTQQDTADITDLERLRKQYGSRAEAAGGKLTVTAILLKVAAAALRTFPQVNASVDMARQEVILKKYVHVGVAVDTVNGLLVPVIRNVDQKNIVQLSVELGELARRARDRKLSLNEMQGGTFSITNLGGIGGSHFTPIVNHPEVAILGISRAKLTPTYVNSELQPRLILPLSLSYDHRLVDGAEAIRFLRWVIDALEQPFLLALES